MPDKTDPKQDKAEEPKIISDSEEMTESDSDIAQLQAENAQLRSQVAEFESRWKRALADYQNLEKRTEERRGEAIQFALKQFFDKFLGVLDDLEMAQKHLQDKGLELAMKKMSQLLENTGLERIETVGKEYDINTMEAIQIIDGEKDNNVVIEHRPGYMMHGSVLRPAHVTVSKKSTK